MKKNLKILLLGNITNDGWKSMELILKEYKQNFNYTKVLIPKSFINRRFYKLFIYPIIALSHRGYDGYHIVDHSYGHLVYFLPKDKTVITCHDLIPIVFKEKMSFIGKLLFKFYISGMKRAKIILADFTIKKDLIKILKINPSKIKLIPHNIDLSNFKKLKNKNKLRKKRGLEDKNVILTIGVGFYKNVPNILRALHLVRQKYPETILLKIGDFGKEEKELIERLNLKRNIIQKNDVSEKTLIELYNCSDVLVFPSIYKGYARPPFEAMACGTPVITSNLPAFEEIKDKDAVIRINPHSVKELSNAIISLIKNPSLKKKLINRGRITVNEFKNYAIKRYPKKLKEIYQQL